MNRLDEPFWVRILGFSILGEKNVLWTAWPGWAFQPWAQACGFMAFSKHKLNVSAESKEFKKIGTPILEFAIPGWLRCSWRGCKLGLRKWTLLMPESFYYCLKYQGHHKEKTAACLWLHAWRKLEHAKKKNVLCLEHVLLWLDMVRWSEI